MDIDCVRCAIQVPFSRSVYESFALLRTQNDSFLVASKSPTNIHLG